MQHFVINSPCIQSSAHFVNYYKKGSVYADEITEWLLEFKDGNSKSIKFWSDVVLEDIQNRFSVDYIVTALGHDDTKLKISSPLAQLSQSLAERLGCSLSTESLIKSSIHASLKFLNKAERQRELEGKYKFNPNGYQPGSSFLIIDDITTTGTTATAIASSIKAAIPDSEIHFYAIAKTTDPYYGGQPKNDSALYHSLKIKHDSVPVEFNDSKIFSGGKRSDKIHSFALKVALTAYAKGQMIEIYNPSSEPQDRNTASGLKMLLGMDKKYDCYLQNSGRDREGEQRVEIIFGTDTDNKNNADLVTKLTQKTIVISGVNKQSEFLVISVRAVPWAVGTRSSSRSIQTEIEFKSGFTYNQGSIPTELAAEVATLPQNIAKSEILDRRLEAWHKYLDIVESTAKGNQFAVKYEGYRQGESLKFITFIVNDAQVDWILLAQSKQERVDICNFHLPQDEGEIIFKHFGTIDKVTKQRQSLKIRLSEEYLEAASDGQLTILPKGIINCSRTGDIVNAQRQKEGLKKLKYGTTENSKLEDFLFDAEEARLPLRGSKITIDEHNMLLKGFRKNKSQVAAVEGALSAPDLYLIQGPPGTGKTTVIAEICYQVAIRGGKTLIASQTNLAVDNALNKLVHDPKIRPFRKGNFSTVEQEGIPFTEDKVVETWLKNTALACSDALDEKVKRLNHLQMLEASLPDHLERLSKLDELVRTWNSQKESASKAESLYLQHTEIHTYVKKDCGEFCNQMLSGTLKTHHFEKIFDGVKYLEISLDKYLQGMKSINQLKIKTSELKSLNRTFKSARQEIEEEYKSLGKKRSNQLLDQENEITSDRGLPDDIHVEKNLKIIRRAKPGLLRRLFGMTKRYEKLLVSEILALKGDETVCTHTLGSLDQQMKTMIDNTINVIRHFEKQRELIEQRYDALVSSSKTAWDESIHLLEEAERAIGDTQIKIDEFHDTLPSEYLEKLPIDVMGDKHIFEAYLGLWKYEKAELEAYVSLSREWIKSIIDIDNAKKQSLKDLYIKNANVFGITCALAGDKRFQTDYPTFDVVIVDEVSKATPPELLLPALRGKKLILIGDHKQLPPMINDSTLKEYAESEGLDTGHFKSMIFKELFEAAAPEIKQTLNVQYRMHDSIMDTINQFYDGKLICGIEDPDEERKHYSQNKFIRADNHVVWFDIPLRPDFYETNHHPGFSNAAEIQVITNILKNLNTGFRDFRGDPEDKKEVGVISFYAKQVYELKRIVEKERAELDALDVRVGTVDRFQGMEKPIIIASFVRNNPSNKIGFAIEPERINVAMSRARELLIVVGCAQLFTKASGEASVAYSNILTKIDNHGGYRDVSELL